MVMGLLAVILFNVVDTFFVGLLGARELAAMSFTFPVTFLVLSLSMGLGIGTTSVLARAIGHGDRDLVRRLATDALALANVVVVMFAVTGLITLEPVFLALGAPADMMGLIGDYMTPWYLGVGFLVIPMVGNSAIRANGDTKTPSYIMMTAGLVNVVLDPLFIFGLGPIPGMGLQGAAIATVISWVLTLVAALWVLAKRERLIDFTRPKFSQVWSSWKQVLQVGVPAAATNMLVPLATALLTRLVAEHGEDAVAAYGVGQRLEAVALIGISAMAVGMGPFVGQNFGAGQCARVRRGLVYALKFALIYGAIVALVLAAFAPWLTALFSDRAQVIAVAELYLWAVPLSYGALGIALQVNATYNAMNRPLRAVFLIGGRAFVLAIPLAYIGSSIFGVIGIFAGISVANGIVGAIAFAMVSRDIRTVERQASTAGQLAEAVATS